MRKSPDGAREVIEMLVPIEGSRSRTVRVTGLGLPAKVCVGAHDLPDETWIEILNRDVKGHLAYDSVETVRGGMMPLHDRHLQGSDQMFAVRSGATFGHGTLEAEAAKDGDVVRVEDGKGIHPGPTTAWIVTDSRMKYMLVVPAQFDLDSFGVADMITKAMCGEFMVEMVTSGSFTARDEVAAPGWKVLIDPPVFPKAENAMRN